MEIPKESKEPEEVWIEIGYINEPTQKKLKYRKLRLEAVKDKTLAEIMEMLKND